MIDRLAKQQACQLFIEQEIEKGLKDGKKPYSIAKELGKWVEKLFEAKIPHDTLERRAERIRDKVTIGTNVPTESTPENEKGIEEKPHKPIRDEKGLFQPGTVPGPGRFPKNFKMPPPSLGMRFARMAVRDLEQISKDDLERTEAFAFVKGWIKENE